LSAFTHPDWVSHVSVVHRLLSLQFNAPDPTHWPSTQVSVGVQALPSLHEPATGGLEQPVAGTQVSPVHGFESSQLIAAPVHWPDALQVSPDVQALASLHA
jgi:hypothetical protein